MTNSLNFGIVGCGHIAENNHIPVILGTNQINISWIFDINKERSYFLSKKFNLNIADSLNKKNINSLLITVPVMSRKKYYKFLIENNMSAFIEKPAFKNYQDFEIFSKEIEKNKIITHFGYNRRFYSNINHLKKIIQKKIFGEIKLIKISEGSSPNRLGRNENWYLQDISKSGGGILIETGSHNLDTLCNIFNPSSLQLNNYKEIYSYNNIELDIETNGQINLNNQSIINFEMKLSYLKNLDNIIEIQFNDISIVMENFFSGKIFLVKNDFKFDPFDIEYDVDIDIIFKKQILYFKDLVENNSFEESYQNLINIGMTTNYIDQCYKNK